MRISAYLRVDPFIDDRKLHYGPAQLGTFLKVLALASRQGHRGRFHSLAGLKSALPRAFSRHIDFLVAEGDLVIQPDGTVAVGGWDLWQEGDLSVADRMRKLRAKESSKDKDLGQSDRNKAVTPPYPAASQSLKDSKDLDSGLGVGIGVGIESPPAPLSSSTLNAELNARGIRLHGRGGVPVRTWNDHLNACLQAGATFKEILEAFEASSPTDKPWDTLALVMKKYGKATDNGGKKAIAYSPEVEAALRKAEGRL